MAHSDLKTVLNKLEAALPVAESSPDCPHDVVEGLKAAHCLLSESAASHLRKQHAGVIRWTFEDDQYEPNGREIEVLIYYDWDDYSAGDGVTPSCGGCAQIADIEILAVRYFDEHGNVIGEQQHHLDVAWDAVESNRELLEEMCSDAGHRDDAGRTAPVRFPGTSGIESPDSNESTWRMTPSARSRGATVRNLKQG